MEGYSGGICSFTYVVWYLYYSLFNIALTLTTDGYATKISKKKKNKKREIAVLLTQYPSIRHIYKLMTKFTNDIFCYLSIKK